MTPDMPAEAVVDLLPLCERSGIEVWLDGGLLCHVQGYVPTEKDLNDMERLQARFGVELPPHIAANPDAAAARRDSQD